MFGRNMRRQKLLQEFAQHIELEVQDNVNPGMSPEEAESAARREFGNIQLAAEDSEAVWGGLWLESLVLDLKYGLRRLKGLPAYTSALVCTLTVGLGAVTTMLAISESALNAPLPLPNSEELFQVYSEGGTGGTSASAYTLTYKAIAALQGGGQSFAAWVLTTLSCGRSLHQMEYELPC